MDQKFNIICFSTIDWGFIWQGHQQIMSDMAKAGHNVLYVENIGVRTPRLKDTGRLIKRYKDWRSSFKGLCKLDNNLYIYSPLIFPFPYSKIFNRVNERLMSHVLKGWLSSVKPLETLIWTFIPTPLVNRLIPKIKHSCLVYYCIDDFFQSSKPARKIIFSEKELIKKADLVFVTAHELRRKCLQYRDEVHLFPFGYDDSFFSRVRSNKETREPDDLKHIKGQRIVYLGGIHKHVDQDLLVYIAQQCPDISFVLIGPAQCSTKKLEKIHNIYMLGQKDKKDVPLYLKFCDVGIIPYLNQGYTQSVYPTKMNEYLAMGLPVISTNIPEVVRFRDEMDVPIKIADSYDSFKHALSSVLVSLKEHKSKIAELCIVKAKQQSWHNKIKKMEELIGDFYNERKLKATNWPQKFEMFFESGRRKVLYLLIFILVSYFTLFHTPLVWHAAQFLTVKQELNLSSDVVLVLGGGVGESGEAGQGYQERTMEAVNLYKQGLTQKIIFSSGYTYLLKEAEIMKDLALSLGVASQDIFIEDKAKNTYENIKFSKKIIEANDFKKVIIVSSPYHLKRVQLVGRKVLTNAAFKVHPMKYSMFYSSLRSNPTLKQYKALLHELAAIILYKLKGYI